ncbi:MAG: LON peptidase substrate-binding domain-containing protein [Pirellulaceae bacterium]
MPPAESLEFPENFAGVVRLFPLPNLVLFPHAVQPLHLFEPRYIQMLEDALAGDQLIAMALLQPDWESDYEGRPPIYPVVCIGRIIAHARLEDGRYNILLQGIRRAALVREFPPEHPFRLAEVAVLEDDYPASTAAQRAQVQRDLLRAFQNIAPQATAAHDQMAELLSRQIPLGTLTDVIAHTLPLRLAFKQQLLAEWNVDVRASLLLQHVNSLNEGQRPAGEPPFPPEFSPN